MDDLALPLLGALVLVALTYYYFVVLNKPKKLAAVPAPMVKKGTAAAMKRKPQKKKVEVRSKAKGRGISLTGGYAGASSPVSKIETRF